MIEKVTQFVERREGKPQRILIAYENISTKEIWYEGHGQTEEKVAQGTIGLNYGFKIEADSIKEAFEKFDEKEKEARDGAVAEAKKQLGVSSIITPTQVVNLNQFDPRKQNPNG